MKFSGEIASLGEGIEGLSAGQEVYGMNDWFEDGALAEYCISQPAWIPPKPERLTHAEAASVPISALTAWQGLSNMLDLRPETACWCMEAQAQSMFTSFNWRSRAALTSSPPFLPEILHLRKIWAPIKPSTTGPRRSRSL